MNKKNAGLVIGAGVGAVLAWLLRRQERAPVELSIELGPKGTNRCAVTREPDRADLHLDQLIIWHITNNCEDSVRVSLEGWRHGNGNPTSPAANPHGMPGLRRKIDGRGGTGDITGKGRFGLFEECLYDVYLDDERGADPIVKLVP